MFGVDKQCLRQEGEVIAAKVYYNQTIYLRISSVYLPQHIELCKSRWLCCSTGMTAIYQTTLLRYLGAEMKVDKACLVLTLDKTLFIMLNVVWSDFRNQISLCLKTIWVHAFERLNCDFIDKYWEAAFFTVKNEVKAPSQMLCKSIPWL